MLFGSFDVDVASACTQHNYDLTSNLFHNLIT